MSLLPWVGRAVLICGAARGLMGWDVWFAPEKWANYGHLPPITLLSFVTAVVFLILRRRRRDSSARMEILVHFFNRSRPHACRLGG